MYIYNWISTTAYTQWYNRFWRNPGGSSCCGNWYSTNWAKIYSYDSSEEVLRLDFLLIYLLQRCIYEWFVDYLKSYQGSTLSPWQHVPVGHVVSKFNVPWQNFYVPDKISNDPPPPPPPPPATTTPPQKIVWRIITEVDFCWRGVQLICITK